MHANLGFDENTKWQVQAITKTQIDGISKVVVLIGDKSGKAATLSLRLLHNARPKTHHRRRQDHSLR